MILKVILVLMGWVGEQEHDGKGYGYEKNTKLGLSSFIKTTIITPLIH